MGEITRLEEQIMLSVWKLGDEAYGISIYQHIQEITKKNMAIGGIYFPLERLVKKGYLEAYKGEPTPVRGGQSKRFYSVTGLGKEVLIDTKMTHEAFWRGLPPMRCISGESG